MFFLHTEIGSAKDNIKSPVHNWYKFTAGFSYKFVEEIIKLENLRENAESKIFDPFAGCGTTLVSSQKEGVNAVGNESQAFMYDIIKAKLNWKITNSKYTEHLKLLFSFVQEKISHYPIDQVAHPLLVSLYSLESLKTIYLIRDYIKTISDEKYYFFFKLALSQTLHRVANHPIAVPYISRNKTISNTETSWNVFCSICEKMINDITPLCNLPKTSQIYKHDSRQKNQYIENESCNLCITSPPYLNNLDYGEVSKVHTHFFENTNNWSDITKKVRKNLVTGSTTHYNESDFNINDFLSTEFSIVNKHIVSELSTKAELIKKIAKERSGKKSFDVLIMYYFQDMYLVLKEIRRVLKNGSKAYLILGDSAPYGIYIPTTEILGNISKNIGFKTYEIQKIRSRGNKWKTLKYRHKVELTENVLILK